MKFICIFFLLIFNNILLSQNQLEIDVTNIKNIGGSLRIGVFNNPDAFLIIGQEFKTVEHKINNHAEKIYISNLPNGKYGIALYHDLNSDSRCNLNFFGIPLEGFGFSKNYRPIFSKPSFDNCVIEVVENTKININLLHYY